VIFEKEKRRRKRRRRKRKRRRRRREKKKREKGGKKRGEKLWGEQSPVASIIMLARLVPTPHPSSHHLISVPPINASSIEIARTH